MFSFDNPRSPLKEGLQREPFEITVLMKREKLQALRSDFMSTREQTDHPYAAQARGSDGNEYTNTQTHKAFHVHTANMYTQIDTKAHTQNHIQMQMCQLHKTVLIHIMCTGLFCV